MAFSSKKVLSDHHIKDTILSTKQQELCLKFKKINELSILIIYEDIKQDLKIDSAKPSLIINEMLIIFLSSR